VAITDPGTVMGTVGYMAPEQVRGQALDARTDLFALGAVLYEMLTGRRAFQHDTAAETLTAILREDPPDLPSVRADLSPALDRIVRHGLEKNPAERFQTARDVAFALEALSGTNVASVSGAVPVPPPAAMRRWMRIAVGAVVAAAVLAAAVVAGRAMRPASSPITFETKTWDAEWITNARFAPDGQTIVFSAALEGAEPRLFVIRPGTVTSQPVGEPDVHLLSVSSKGELAVLTGAQFRGHRLFRGTLARMTMDGAPRPWMTGISEADWSPDGSTLAVIRIVNARSQLEYPVGRVLYARASGYLSDPRVSPDGTRVAFFEHQDAGDDRGWVKTVDANGVVTTLAGEYRGEEGLAWSADSRTVYFSGSGHNGQAYQPQLVNTAGAPVVRQAVASAGAMFVHDVAPDGRLLVTREDLRSSLRALVPGESSEREFAWLDAAMQGFLSHDRQFLVFGDESQSAGTNYAVARREVTNARVVRLGEGEAGPPSPDGTWVLALIPSSGQLVLYPIGPGEVQPIIRGPIERYSGNFQNLAQWLPDGRTLLLCGIDAAKIARCYEQAVPAGTPRPVTPAGVIDAWLAPDARTLLARQAAGGFQVLSIGGATPAPARGLTRDDVPIAWASDSRAVVVDAGSSIPARIVRVDPATGIRTLITTLAPPDRAGLVGVVPSQWIDDGRGYVYTYFRDLSQLFVASGVRP
jgi:dipeptidyl aminopeptidase/acylaminoacyl peptidase